MSITLRVYGNPAPQGSKKHVGNGRLIETSKKLPSWRNAVQEVAAEKALLGTYAGALEAHVTIILTRPRATKFKQVPCGPPDLDKLIRAVGDGLEKGGLIDNDSRIVRWDAHKRWAKDGEAPGAYIVIRHWEGKA